MSTSGYLPYPDRRPRGYMVAGSSRRLVALPDDDGFDDSPAPWLEMPAQPHTDPAAGERTLSQIFSTLWKRKYLIITLMFVVGLAAYIVALQKPLRYTAEGIMSIQTRPLYMPQLGIPLTPVTADTAIARSEALILTSRELLETVARKLKLNENPDLNPYLRDPTFFDRVVDAVKGGAQSALSMVGVGDGPAAAPTGDDESRVWAAVVDSMTRALDVRTDGRSYVIYIDFESESPQVSAGVVNALMETFIGNQIASAGSAVSDANVWIKQRAEELRKEVADADSKVQAYRNQNGLVETRMGSVSSQQLNELNTQLSLARADRAAADANYNRARGDASRTGLADSTSEVLNSMLIQRLREKEAELVAQDADLGTRFGRTHPQRQAVISSLNEVRGQINREIQKILVSLRNQADGARSRESALTAQIQQLQGRAAKTADAEVGLNALEKEAETKRNVYQSFLATAQQTAGPSGINQSNANIVSRAMPPIDPSAPRKKLFVLAGLFIGFLASAAGVLLFAELDRGFDNPEQAEHSLGLPILGVLPNIRRKPKRGEGLGKAVIDTPDPSILETLRGIRITLRLRTRRSRSQVLLITSSEPGEGKTTFASAMAAAAAQDGIKVLVIDSDLRRPRLHRLFRAEPGPSLQDVLRGAEAWPQAVRTDATSGADCMTAYERTDSPVALLTSGHWQEFLSQARKVYELIILDSPPVMEVADALTLADHVDSVVFITACKSTLRRTAQEALRRFASTGKQIAGVVLTKAPLTGHVRTSYAGYAA